MMTLPCVLVFAAGCGRLGFDEPIVASDARADADAMLFDDLPGTSIVGPGLPLDLPGQFDVPNGADIGPCMLEPASGAHIPSNFTPPWFEWSGAAGEVYELRLHVDNQANDLVAYTTQTIFALPPSTWPGLAQHSGGYDLEFSIRAASFDGTMLTSPPRPGTSGTLHLAPVAAEGAIVYWTTTGGSALKGFRVGDPAVRLVLQPPQLGDGTQCLGCHASSPDGAFTLFSRRNAPVGVPDPFSVDVRLVDGSAQRPTAVTFNGLSNLARTNQNFAVMSRAHYSANEAVVISTLQSDTASPSELVYTDLAATTGGAGTIARTGDLAKAAAPAWSHDGTTIAYVSSTDVKDGRTLAAPTDIRTVPYNSGAGGTSVPLAGAAESNVQEVFPAFSSDDRWVGFNRIAGTVDTYDQPMSEVYVVPSTGGSPLRLAANDPPSCGPYRSPGITNSWPRWAPVAPEVADGGRYYWLVFSSRRRGGPTSHPQLYLAAVIERSDGTLESYPAIYFSAQPADESNHTPAWDRFEIPIQ